MSTLCVPSSLSLLPSGHYRFHILCGYLLCEEQDLSVYDPAINQEHLMKCLQSLTEAYRDLRQQVGWAPQPGPPAWMHFVYGWCCHGDL